MGKMKDKIMKEIILKHFNELGKDLEESYGNKLIIIDEKDFDAFAETLIKKLTIDSDMSDKKVNVIELLEKEVEAFKIIASFVRLKESIDKGEYNDCKRVKSIMNEILNK